jgi:hypothetical protein
MIKHIVERDGDDVPDLTFARGFGTTLEEAKANLAPLLASHQKLEAESETWWSRYLSEVPGLEIPDEGFAKNYLWSWANFRMNRLEVLLGIMPAGMVTVNNCRIKPRVALSLGDPVEIEAIQHMHDPKPARDAMLFLLLNTRKQGLMSVGFYAGKENPGNYPECLGWLAGLVHKYILSTGDIGLLSEEIGDGLTFLERMENGLEAQLPQRDEKTGLFWNDGEMKRFGGLYPGEFSGMGPVMEAVTRIRGARGTYHSEVSANVWGTFVAMADIEELAGNDETSARYRTMADDLGQAIRNHLWDEKSGMFRDLDENRNMTEYMGMGGGYHRTLREPHPSTGRPRHQRTGGAACRMVQPLRFRQRLWNHLPRPQKSLLRRGRLQGIQQQLRHALEQPGARRPVPPRLLRRGAPAALQNVAPIGGKRRPGPAISRRMLPYRHLGNPRKPLCQLSLHSLRARHDL